MVLKPVAEIELVAPDDQVIVSSAERQFHGIKLDQKPDGMFSTAFTTRTISGAYQIGGRAAGHEVPVRKMVLPFNLSDAGDGIDATVSRFRRFWQMGRDIEWRYTTEESGTRVLRIRLSREIQFSPEVDWGLHGYAKAVVEAIALQPMYEGPEQSAAWSNPSAGTNTGYLPCWNPTDQDMFLEWSFDPATSWSFADWSFGNEKRWKRPAGADSARAIVTPALTQRLSVMADPMMDTYVSQDLSNAAGLFNGVEPVYWVPPYTGSRSNPILLPVVCNGPKDATVVLTMRRLWSAEAGLE